MREGVRKLIQFGTGHGEHQARLRAKLANAERERLLQSLGKRRPALAQCARQQEDRIQAAHLGKDGDRIRPRGRRVEQRPACGARASEPRRARVRMFHQRCPDDRAAAVQQRKHAGRQPASVGRRAHGGGDQFGGAGMAAVGFDDDRAAGRQRARRVAPGHGERERKVARTKHGDRPERNQHAAQVWFRRGLAVGLRGIKARVHPRPVAHKLGEKPELPDGPRPLALEPCFR